MKTLMTILTLLISSQSFAEDFSRSLMWDAIGPSLECEEVKRKMRVEEDSYGGSEREITFKNKSAIICNRYTDLVTSLKLTRAGAYEFFAPTIQDLFDLSENQVISKYGTPDDYDDSYGSTTLYYDDSQTYPVIFDYKNGNIRYIRLEFPNNED